MKVYELMVLVAKEPEKYEGRKYKVINEDTACIDYYGDIRYEVFFKDNNFEDEEETRVYFSMDAELEEIIESKILTFEEVWNLPLCTMIMPVENIIDITSNYYSLDWWKHELGKLGSKVIVLMTQSKWKIKE